MTRDYKKVQQDDDLEDAPVLVATPLELANEDHDNNNNSNNNNEDGAPGTAPTTSCWNPTRCAGCVGALAGCCASGLCVSLICATGCMYCAKTQDNIGGDMARAFGRAGVQANVMIRDLDEQHNLMEKAKQFRASSWNQAKQWNEDYQITQTTKNCVVSTIQGGVAYAQEHELVERTTRGVRTVLSVVAKEVTTRTDDGVVAAEVFSDPEIHVTDENEGNPPLGSDSSSTK